MYVIEDDEEKRKQEDLALNDMFSDIGNTLYVVGKVMFVIFIVIGILLLLSLCTVLSDVDGFLFIILTVAMFFNAFIIALPICGFGRLIQDVHELKKELQEYEYVDE